MKVGEYCNREVVIVTRDESIQAAVNLMRAHHVGDVVVLESSAENARPVGILTDRDIVLEILAQGIDMKTVRIGDVMSHELVTVAEDSDFMDAIELMRKHAIRRLPVENAAGGLAGILAVDDALEIIAEQLNGIVRLVSRQTETEQRRRQ